MPRHLPIKDWALENRPREKLVKQGQKSLTDAELLAILLSSGTKNETAVMLAKRILAHFDHQLDRLHTTIPQVKFSQALPTMH